MRAAWGSFAIGVAALFFAVEFPTLGLLLAVAGLLLGLISLRRQDPGSRRLALTGSWLSVVAALLVAALVVFGGGRMGIPGPGPSSPRRLRRSARRRVDNIRELHRLAGP